MERVFCPGDRIFVHFDHDVRAFDFRLQFRLRAIGHLFCCRFPAPGALLTYILSFVSKIWTKHTVAFALFLYLDCAISRRLPTENNIFASWRSKCDRIERMGIALPNLDGISDIVLPMPVPKGRRVNTSSSVGRPVDLYTCGCMQRSWAVRIRPRRLGPSLTLCRRRDRSVLFYRSDFPMVSGWYSVVVDCLMPKKRHTEENTLR